MTLDSDPDTARQDVIDRLAQRWRDAGVGQGDVLLLHSSLKRTARALIALGRPRETVAREVLDSVLTALGEAGTLLLPLFNFDFTRGVLFDLRATPSQMGLLTETGRLHPQCVRTGHPIYSFAALGRERERFRGVRNFSGYGADSPFALLREMGGRIGVLDLPDQHAMTFYHHVEEMEGVDYRYHKRFTGPYVDALGETTIETFGLFVRDLERGVLTEVDAMGERLWALGLYGGDRPGSGSGLRVIAAEALYQTVAGVIREGRAEGLLYRIEETAR